MSTQEKNTVWDHVRSMQADRPSSLATFKSYFRNGLHTVQEAVTKAFPDSLPVRDDSGTLGNPTPQMVTRDLEGGQSYSSMLHDFASRASYTPEQERNQEMTR